MLIFLNDYPALVDGFLRGTFEPASSITQTATDPAVAVYIASRFDMSNRGKITDIAENEATARHPVLQRQFRCESVSSWALI
ncbi:hypothetical protein CCP4SC76_150016 [Gammaproteobacteria bacterium]